MTAIVVRALELANATRVRAADVKREVRDGRMPFADALEDERAASVPISDLLVAVPGIAKIGMRRLLGRAFVGGHRRVRDLTSRERGVLVRLVAECAYTPARQAKRVQGR